MDTQEMFSRGPHDYLCEEDRRLDQSEIVYHVYHGEPTSTQCMINDGNNEKDCPGKPEFFFEIGSKRIGICKNCYEKFQKSIYNQDRAKARNEKMLFQITNGIRDKSLSYEVPF
jgi:hypothetical protein